MSTIMNPSLQSLIILGDTEKSQNKLQEILKEYKISKFDTTFISSEKSLGIPDIKLVHKNILLKPSYSDTKAVIMDCSNGITQEAQNALLKLLEEPPKNTIIILTTLSLDIFLPTILSRCSLINLIKQKQISKEELNNFHLILNNILEKKENPLVMAQDFGKDRKTALEFLEKLIIVTEKNLISNIKLKDILKKLQSTYQVIKTTNVNVRFALENLFLNL